MYILAIGASRNIGYHATRQLLAEGHTVTFLLRKSAVFDNDTEIQKHVQEGRARLVQGDATIRSDVQRAYAEARVEGKLDVVLFSVGGKPSFSLTKGVTINPANLCSSSLYNVLLSIPPQTLGSPQPKLIAISFHGITKAEHRALPLLVKPIFSHLLHGPHVDKLVMERAIFHAAGWTWTEGEPENSTKFLGPSWKTDLQAGFLEQIVIIRPTLLTDGDDKPATGRYKTSTEEIHGAYSITRKEVAHFVVEGLIKKWEDWNGKIVRITQ